MRTVSQFLFRISLLGLLATGLMGAAPAFADDCGALGGSLVSGECRVTSVVTASGAYTLDETLHVLGNGRIDVPADPSGNTLTLDIDGDLIIEIPTVAGRGRISGDVTGATALGATITVNATGNIYLKGNGTTGARISSTHSGPGCTTGRAGDLFLNATQSVITERNTLVSVSGSCPGGEIDIQAQDVQIGGRVLSESTLGGANAERPGGGPVSVVAGCNLLVERTAIVRSKGFDPGSDLVYLEGGCDVTIYGQVASTGQGHRLPSNPATQCHGAARPGKPTNSTSCLEIRSGGALTIDSIAPRAGEVQVDSYVAGALNKGQQSWLDLFARNDITLVGEAAGAYVVHANGIIAGATAGAITIQSAEGAIIGSRRAVQANATASSGKGGAVLIEADGDVSLTNALVQARGATSGTGRAGGTIEIRSFDGAVSGVAPGELRATGGPPVGTILLTACSGVNYTGTVVPAAGVTSGVCGGAPTLPTYLTLPECACAPLPPEPNIRVTKVGNGTIAAGDTASFTITVYNDGPGAATGVVLTDTLPGTLSWQENPDTLCTITGGTSLDCAIGTLAEGASFAVTVEAVTSTSDCGTLPNTATVSATNEAPASDSDNSASDTVTVTCPLECPTVPDEEELVCLPPPPPGSEAAECAHFGGGAPLGKDEPITLPYTAVMDAAVVIVKTGSGQTSCPSGNTAYRVYTNVTTGDPLTPPTGADSISHVTYCGCPPAQ